MFEALPAPQLTAELARLSRLVGAAAADGEVDTADPGAVALPDATVVDGLAAATALAGWAEAVGLRLVGVLRERRREEHGQLVAELGGQAAVERAGGPSSSAEVDRFTAVEVAAAMRVSQRAAQERVRLADDLVRRQPGTLAALSAGLIGLSHARAVRDALDGAEDDEIARCVDQQVVSARALRRDQHGALAGGGEWSIGTPPQLAASVRRALARVDPDSLLRRCEAARRRRGVSSWGLPDGMAALQVTAPALDVAAVVASLDVHAREAVRAAGRSVEAGRLDSAAVPSLDEARADAALTLLLGTSDVVARPVPHVSIGLDVLVPVEELRGVGGSGGVQGARVSSTGAPAELPGIGPLPTPIARAVARAARRVQVVPLSPGGAVDTLSLPREDRYTPSARLQRAVRARDVTCRWPGCRRRANGCDLDHTLSWPDGPTAAGNLACYCRTHHRAKHRAGWSVAQRAQGRLVHTSPTGHTYGTDPPSWAGDDVTVDVGEVNESSGRPPPDDVAA